jgi:type II secretory ATPase GspE/PulE/Tfp pilus assembly ATPase PilB-like protein
MPITDEHLLDAALRKGLVQHDVLAGLRLEARKQHVDLLDAVAAHYRFPRSAFYRAVAEVRGLEFIDPTNLASPPDLLRKIPQSLMRRKRLLPLSENEESVVLAVADPEDRATIDSVQRMLGRRMRVAMADPQALDACIGRALNNVHSRFPAEEAAPEDTDLVALLDDILREAYLSRASDIHFVTVEAGLRVRLRIDGRLRDYPVDADAAVASGLVSRVKVLANLDIAEQREPQDGGFSYRLGPPIDRELNIRVATAPTRLGERVTMRLLGQEAHGLTLTQLGMQEDDLVRFRRAIRKPFGLILLTGPTGSGKSTTLFAALQEINHPEINIMTVENPIEYVMDGVSQIQTGAKISFADALRSLLRHDPDVLMVGEIRDSETADVAVKAAMTGHLVFSTLHTNNAAGAVTRLADIGCEPFLIGSTLNAVIAQRLVRRLCTSCRKPRTATPEEATMLGAEGETIQLWEPGGCALCQGRGYSGRIGLFETLWFDEALGRKVARGAGEEEIEAIAGDNLKHMWEDGVVKVRAGLTTLDELKEVAVYKMRSKDNG